MTKAKLDIEAATRKFLQNRRNDCLQKFIQHGGRFTANGEPMSFDGISGPASCSLMAIVMLDKVLTLKRPSEFMFAIQAGVYMERAGAADLIADAKAIQLGRSTGGKNRAKKHYARAEVVRMIEAIQAEAERLGRNDIRTIVRNLARQLVIVSESTVRRVLTSPKISRQVLST